MAHIANCLADQEVGSISKPPSPVLSGDSAANDDKPFTFRMQQPEQPRRYQFFPKDKPLPALKSNKNVDASVSQDADKTEKPSTAAGLKIKISQQNLIRRRKVSVPELGPMTTVQEVSMDSPTIPGRPPLHERSISAPGHSSRHRHGTNDMLPPPGISDIGEGFAAAIEAAIDTAEEIVPSPPAKQLARLVIPQDKMPQLSSFRSCGHLRTGSNGEPRSGRTEFSPRTRTPFTPNSAFTDLTTPRSASTSVSSAAIVPTPKSAVEISRASPKPWERRCMTPSGTERTNFPQADDPVRSESSLGHRRGGSESSSMMDRGRPRKRLQQNASMSDLKAAATRTTDRKAFEELPKGWTPSVAINHLNATETDLLRKQAVGQAERFEVLSPEDVDNLSKELRRLDERTEYLRRTHNSLRSGRRNLHSRICQYLRSPRVAKFSHDSMLKQEEALAELDASIDDWVYKLEKAENRRTRVRQKLLEHVAAATLLAPSPDATRASGSLQEVMGISGARLPDMATPPRSPSKQTFSPRNGSTSPSPQRVVAQVPSTIMEQPLEEAAERLPLKSKSLRRGDVESIRIYAGDDVYALLADVENEISKMSVSAGDGYMNDVTDVKRTELLRQQSHEMLNGTLETKKDMATPLTPPAPTPPMKDSYGTGDVMLTNAVFKP